MKHYTINNYFLIIMTEQEENNVLDELNNSSIIHQ